MDITLRIISPPLAVLIIGCIEVQEVREETTGRHLTSQLIQIEVTILRQIIHSTFLLPNLDGEDSRLTTTHALIGREQNLTHHTTTLGTRIRTIVDGGEHHLVSTTRMDGIHIMDKRLHGLMHTSHSLIDSMLLGTLLSQQTIQRFLDIVHQWLIIEILIVLTIQVLKCLQFLDIGQTHIRGQIEIKSGDCLTSMHLVLTALH